MDLVSVYKKVITDQSASWVLFKHGTCVMLLKPEINVQEQAVEILRQHGPVTPGTPSGDFEVIKIPEVNGWLVIGNYPGMMMYVSNEEAGKKDDFEIGMIGRTKREQDAKELEVTHIKFNTHYK